MIKYQVEVENKVGIIKGSSLCVLIKPESDDNFYGHKGRYIEIAGRINKEFGLTVCVSVKSLDSEKSLFDEISVIRAICPFVEDFLFIGVSAGGLVGAQQAWMNYQVKKMLLINLPLMLNIHKTKEGLSKFDTENAMIVYGERDNSFRNIQLLKEGELSKIKLFSVPDADRRFTGMAKELEEIIIYFVQDSVQSLSEV